MSEIVSKIIIFLSNVRLTNNTNELASINANDVVVYLRSLTEL